MVAGIEWLKVLLLKASSGSCKPQEGEDGGRVPLVELGRLLGGQGVREVADALSKQVASKVGEVEVSAAHGQSGGGGQLGCEVLLHVGGRIQFEEALSLVTSYILVIWNGLGEEAPSLAHGLRNWLQARASKGESRALEIPAVALGATLEGFTLAQRYLQLGLGSICKAALGLLLVGLFGWDIVEF